MASALRTASTASVAGSQVASPRVGRQVEVDMATRCLHEHVLEAVEALEAPSGAEHDRLEGEVDQPRAHRGLLLDAQVEAAQHRAATDEVDPLGEEVLRQLGG